MSDTLKLSSLPLFPLGSVLYPGGLLPLPLELKQRLMELDNPLVRLELVSDILERTGIAL